MAARAKKAAGKKAPAKQGEAPSVDAVLAELRRNASKQYRADMSARYGIVTKAEVYGTPVGKLRVMAKRIGRDHELAQRLWRTGIHDARMLAPMVGDPALVTPAEMERWATDFDNWGIVDTVCFHYWDRTLHAFKQIEKWSKAKDEYVKRTAFALMASCALHGRGSEEDFLRGLELIEREASDPRNFVKKGVNWALRAIGGKQSPKLRTAARVLATRLSESEDATERWNGKDALRAFAKG